MILVRGPHSRGGSSGKYRVVPAASERALSLVPAASVLSQNRVIPRAPRAGVALAGPVQGLGAMVACPLEYISWDNKCCNFIDENGECIGEGPGQTIVSADGTRRQIGEAYDIVTAPDGTQKVIQKTGTVVNVAVKPGAGTFAEITKLVSDNSTAVGIAAVVFLGVVFMFRR